ncbi:MAG: hypothetical protein VCD16_12775 [Planctomycetota bacterium]
MIRRLRKLLENHYALVVSSLISSIIIISLALLAGLSAGRDTRPRAWAMDSSRTVKTASETPAEETQAVELLDEPEALPEAVAAEPAASVMIEAPAPELPLEMTAAPEVETGLPESPAQNLNEEAETAVKPADAESRIKEAVPEEPAPAEPTRRAVRTLGPRSAVPIRPGRILRPRR